MKDETEDVRRNLAAAINAGPADRARLEKEHGVGNVWDTKELGQTFEVLGFMAPFCIVRRKSDGKEGTVVFQHYPRFYFNWLEDK